MEPLAIRDPRPANPRRRDRFASPLGMLLGALLSLGGAATAQQVWLPNCPNQGVQAVPASRVFGPAVGSGPAPWLPSWVIWTPAHRTPTWVRGQYLRAARYVPVRIGQMPSDPRLFLRGPYQVRVLGTVLDAMPGLCAVPFRR